MTAAEKKHAAQEYRTAIKAITALVKTATSDVHGLTSAALVRRQTGTALADLVAELLEEISGALNNIIATLGLSMSYPCLINPRDLAQLTLVDSLLARVADSSRLLALRLVAQLGSRGQQPPRSRTTDCRWTSHGLERRSRRPHFVGIGCILRSDGDTGGTKQEAPSAEAETNTYRV